MTLPSTSPVHAVVPARLFQGLRHVTRVLFVTVIVLAATASSSLCNGPTSAMSDGPRHWVGTWSTALQLVEPGNMPPSPG